MFQKENKACLKKLSASKIRLTRVEDTNFRFEMRGVLEAV